MTGENCRCQNNTISDGEHCRRRHKKPGKEGDRPQIASDFFTTSSASSDSMCQRFQCSKCKEYYVGSPTDSHQCYRQMTVDTDYCLDPKTQSKCYAGGQPAPLEHGQTVYFAVLPKFMNVDIRVVVDVTEGNVDVFFSPESQMFVVNTNKKTWEHEVHLDPQFSFDVFDDEYTSVYSQYRDKLWHKDYFDTDPLFKLVKEKREKGPARSEETKKNSNPGAENDQQINSKDDNKNGNQRMAIHRSFMELLRKEFLRYKNGINILSEKSNLSNEGVRNSSKSTNPSQSESKREKRDEQLWRFRTPKDLKKYAKEIQFLRRLTRLSGRRMSVPAQLAKNITLRNGHIMPNADGREITYEYIRKDCSPDALHTFIHVPNPHFVLHVRNLRNRLVISLPDHFHDLRTTRFFLIVQSLKANATVSSFSKKISRPPDGYEINEYKGDNLLQYSHLNVYTRQTKTTYMINSTIGSLVFRQDQLHIDLFVFFSVFFSCFFLFLSLCVIVWKFKSMSDIRTARRRHAVEMQYMAQRPFATQNIVLEPNKTIPESFQSSSRLNNRIHRKSDNPQMGITQVRQHQLRSQAPLFEPYHRTNQR